MHTLKTITFKPIALAVALAFSAPAIAQQQTTEQQLPEVRVSGSGAPVYREEEATTATKIPAPLRDIASRSRWCRAQ